MRYEPLDPPHQPHPFHRVFRWLVIDRLLGRRRSDPPGPPAPRVEPDPAAHGTGEGPARLTWLGHAGFFGVVDGTSFLVDPTFYPRIGGFYRRFVPAGLAPGQLPEIDVLLVTHSHYDHLDSRSVEALSRSLTAVVPRGLGGFFRRRGFRDVRELAWWEATDLGPVRITFVPASHWSRRTPWDTNTSLWGGFVIAGRDRAVYHAGDSAWFDGFAEIGERFPGLDAALLPIGAYDPRWFMRTNHMDPEEAGRAYLELGARRLVPMHWGTFRLTDEPLSEPIERLESWWAETRPPGELARLAVGETLWLAETAPGGG